MSNKDREPNHLYLDLDRLEDTVYMEVITSSPAWARLDRYMRGSFLVDFLNQLRASELPESTRHKVTEVFLRNLSDEERAKLQTTIEVSGLLDTLIDMSQN